ncbi:MAG: type IX secretion system membrane protein PorP/SprF [Bacteroidota bacterium]
MTKYLSLIVISFFFCLPILWSQQEAQFSQFMHYRQGLNPGFVGSEENVSIMAMSRNQWLGIEGAPETQLISVTAPILNQRIGVGGNILRQSIGVTDFYTLDGMYSYRLKVPRGFLGVGLQASIRLLQSDFTDLRGTQPIAQDEAVPQGIQSKFVPNFGVGLYYHSRNFYLGFSIPRLLSTNIDLSDDSGVIAKEVTHAYMMTGTTIKLGESLSLQPQFLLKYVQGAPFDADMNLNLLIGDKFSTGVSYRLGGSIERGIGEAASLLVGIQLSKSMFLGLAYDATLSELRNYSSGTIEGLVRYRIGAKEEEDDAVDNPRFFN